MALITPFTGDEATTDGVTGAASPAPNQARACGWPKVIHGVAGRACLCVSAARSRTSPLPPPSSF